MWWAARAWERNGARVSLCEVVFEADQAARQAILRSAIKAFLAVQGHPHLPALEDVFSEGGHAFFVFAAPASETLSSLMQRAGGRLPEQDIIACCLQIAETLEDLSRQPVPLVHGFLSPEHLVLLPGRPLWLLTRLSVLANCQEAKEAPPFGQERFSVQADLFALLSTASTAVTGVTAARRGDRLLPARQRYPHVSAAFGAILARALHADERERYHCPSDLIRALQPLLRPPADVGEQAVGARRAVSEPPKAAPPSEQGPGAFPGEAAPRWHCQRLPPPVADEAAPTLSMLHDEMG